MTDIPVLIPLLKKISLLACVEPPVPPCLSLSLFSFKLEECCHNFSDLSQIGEHGGLQFLDVGLHLDYFSLFDLGATT